MKIKTRITSARRIIGCINGILWSGDIGKQRKYNIYNTLVKSSLVNEAETWRVIEQNKRKLEAVEMNAMRISLKILRRDRVKNEEIRRQIGIKITLYNDIESKQEERLLKKVIQWIHPHCRKRGSPKKFGKRE